MNKIEEDWCTDLVKAIEWKTFEKFCAELLNLSKLKAFRTPLGKDKGIDIYIYKNGNFDIPYGIAQCKAWSNIKVGIKNVREFYGAMASCKIHRGFFFTTNEFTQDAEIFAKENGIISFDGKRIIKTIGKGSDNLQNYLKKFLEMDNFFIPTCPSCNKKMLIRTGKNKDDPFWGCRNFPLCKQTFKVSEYQRKFLDQQ